MCTGLGLYVHLMFRGQLGSLQIKLHGELENFKEALRKELRDGYVDAKLADAQMRPLLVGLARIDEVERYAHLCRHDWANQALGQQMSMHAIETRLDNLEKVRQPS
jgi:hypothetical protein